MTRQLPDIISLWLYPLHSVALIFNILCSVLLYICIRAGLFGLWMGLFVAFWVAKYAFVLLEHRARGFDDFPVFSSEMIGIHADLRPWKLLAFTGLFIALHIALVRSGVDMAAQAVLYVYLFLLPAQIVILALEDSFFDMFNVVKLIRFVLQIGPVYLLMLAGLAGGYAAIVFAAESGIALVSLLFVFQYILYLVAASLGRILYRKRHALGFVAHRSPERDEEELDEWRNIHYGRFLGEMYAMRKSGRFALVAERIRDYVEKEGGDAEIYAWFYRELGGWQDLRIRTLYARYYLAKLLQDGDVVTALNVFDIEAGVNSDYCPDDPVLVLGLAQAAVVEGRYGQARRMLLDFDRLFPGSSQVCDAMISAIVLLSDKFQDFEEARSMLRKLCSRYPDAYHDPRLTPWLDIIL